MFLVLHMQQSAKSSQQAGNRSPCVYCLAFDKLPLPELSQRTLAPEPPPHQHLMDSNQKAVKPGGVIGRLSCLLEITVV